MRSRRHNITAHTRSPSYGMSLAGRLCWLLGSSRSIRACACGCQRFTVRLAMRLFLHRSLRVQPRCGWTLCSLIGSLHSTTYPTMSGAVRWPSFRLSRYIISSIVTLRRTAHGWSEIIVLHRALPPTDCCSLPISVHLNTLATFGTSVCRCSRSWLVSCLSGGWICVAWFRAHFSYPPKPTMRGDRYQGFFIKQTSIAWIVVRNFLLPDFLMQRNFRATDG